MFLKSGENHDHKTRHYLLLRAEKHRLHFIESSFLFSKIKLYNNHPTYINHHINEQIFNDKCGEIIYVTWITTPMSFNTEHALRT